MMTKVFILKHVANEDAGTILDFLESNGIAYERINLYDGQSLPDLIQARALLIMGGPMNVYEEDKHPFLKAETDFLKNAIRAEIPCLGICLGSQLLAKAEGRRVYKAGCPEVGWMDVNLTAAAEGDRVFSSLGRGRLKVLQWHEDTFDLPEGALRLASSPVAENQAFRLGKSVYGLQFHIEVNRPILEDWFKNSGDLSGILAEYESYQKTLETFTDRFYKNFFELPFPSKK